MHLRDIPFGTTDWAAVPETRHPGETGEAIWRTCQFGEVRVRMVEYSPGYLADHWCDKGHIILVLAGEMTTELKDGRAVSMKPGLSYQVGDGAMAHRSRTEQGAKLFIVD